MEVYKTYVRTVADDENMHYCHVRICGKPGAFSNIKYGTVMGFERGTGKLIIALSPIQTVGSIEMSITVKKDAATLKFGVRRHILSRIQTPHRDYVYANSVTEGKQLTVEIPVVVMKGLVPHGYVYTPSKIPEKRETVTFVSRKLKRAPAVKFVDNAPVEDNVRLRAIDLRTYLSVMEENGLSELKIPNTNVSLKT